jgi:ABC-type transport system involved in multi-copper enzyme maturation permease subunit
MNLRPRRIRAILRKELREYRRHRSVIVTMAIFPTIFLVQPIVLVFLAPSGTATGLSQGHLLLYMLGLPVLAAGTLAAYAIAGERQQGTLEPVLTTPIRPEELLVGKMLAVLAPSIVIAYAVFAAFLALVVLFANPAVASALLQGPDIGAQIVFTPLLAGWASWVGIAISTRSSDVRVAQQLTLLANLPLVGLTSLIAFDAIEPSPGLAIGLGAVLLVGDLVAWRIVTPLVDRERLVTNG